MELIRSEISGYNYYVLSSEAEQVLFDTVPEKFACEWLKSAPQATKLILTGNDPFPGTVSAFLKERPEGKVFGTPYVIYQLEKILGELNSEWIQDGEMITLCGRKADITLKSFPGKASCATISIPHVGCVPSEMEEENRKGQFFTGGKKEQKVPVVAVVYVSGCDYTEMVASDIASGINDCNVTTRMIDLASVKTSDALNQIAEADGILFGSPTKDGDADIRMRKLLCHADRGIFEGTPASAFGAYTREGEAVPNIIDRLKQLRMKVRDGGFRVLYAPDETARSSSYEYGYDFACFLTGTPNTHMNTLVKCLVCGEIFDASLGACPVCGVGLDRCVPADEDEVFFEEDTDRSYVIIGGGTAAVSAAQAIRRRDQTGKIIMISKEPELPVNRPMISKKMVLVDRTPMDMLIKPKEWYDEKNITVLTGTVATKIKPKRHEVILKGGSVISYDKLIYAAGAECFVPPIPGSNLKGVMTIRHFKDVHDLIRMKPGLKDVIVIGGGVLGLEAASELRKMYAEVTVLEMAPWLMSRQLDQKTALKLAEDAEQFGIRSLCGVQIKEISGEEKVREVILKDGTVLPAQIVIISCGNIGNIRLAMEAGISTEKSVAVNSRMETSVDDIYACGDCAELDGINYQLWAESSQQGRVAGANAAGEKIEFEKELYGTSFEGMNLKLFAIGDLGINGKDYKTIEYNNELDGCSSKFWFNNGKICGGLLYGDISKTDQLIEAINTGCSKDLQLML